MATITTEQDMVAELSDAAKDYRSERTRMFPFPETYAQYEQLLEIAFLEGARWLQVRTIAEFDQRLSQLGDTLK